MSSHSDEARIRELVKRLDEIQRESELIRARIGQIRNSSPEFPERRRRSRLFDGIDCHTVPDVDDGLD